MPVKGWPIATAASFLSSWILTVSHQSTVPVMIRFVRRIVARRVPFIAAHRTRAEMHVLADREIGAVVLDRRHRHPVEQIVGGQIVTTKVTVLR